MPGGSTCNRIFGVSDGRVVPLHAPPSGLEDLVGVAAPSCPCRIVLVSEAVSTNLLALSLADSLADGDVVLAGAQSAGRGRLGRDWHSPPGNLYLTFALRPSCDPRIVTALTIVAAVALADAVAPFVDPPPAIRWPNDLLLGGRKAAGILAQTLPEGGGRFVALGVGINVVTPEGGSPRGCARRRPP